LPRVVCVYDKSAAQELATRVDIPVLSGPEGIKEICLLEDVERIVAAMVGTAALPGILAALEAGREVALANKEILVAGGELVAPFRDSLIPIDSEHSAIFQCLHDEPQRIILTASGGPFRNTPIDKMGEITVKDALNHPTWSMGSKNTIDSSTLMNKGLELIEAHWLFNIPIDKIDIIIHPQSIVHGMCEFNDGSLLAHLSPVSMEIPIQYALTFPERLETGLARLNLTDLAKLEFFEPDYDKFRCLRLAEEAITQKGSMPCYMNAANEVLVDRFLEGEIGWRQIGEKLESLMENHNVVKHVDLEALLAIETRAKEEARAL